MTTPGIRGFRGFRRVLKGLAGGLGWLQVAAILLNIAARSYKELRKREEATPVIVHSVE